jgi:hypothetical protein
MLLNGAAEEMVYGTTCTENSYVNSCSWREKKEFFFLVFYSFVLVVIVADEEKIL